MKRKKKGVTTSIRKICPKCKSARIFLYMGGHFGKYLCHDCGYLGPLIVEVKERKKQRKKKKLS